MVSHSWGYERLDLAWLHLDPDHRVCLWLQWADEADLRTVMNLLHRAEPTKQADLRTALPRPLRSLSKHCSKNSTLSQKAFFLSIYVTLPFRAWLGWSEEMDKQCSKLIPKQFCQNPWLRMLLRCFSECRSKKSSLLILLSLRNTLLLCYCLVL